MDRQRLNFQLSAVGRAGIRNSIRTEFRDDEIRNLARSGGMKLMQEDALEKVRSGVTTRSTTFETPQARVST